MKTKDNIKDILSALAESHGLKLIETTSEVNGYPANLKYAVIGFDSFEQAFSLAAEHGLRVETFMQRNGWGLCEAVSFRTSKDVEDFFLDDFNGGIAWNSLDEVFERCAKVKKIADMVENLRDDEMVVCCYTAESPEVYKIHVMQYTHDTKTHAIGLIA